MRRTFRVTVTTTAELTLDSSVIREATSDEWRKMFWDLRSAEDVAAHVGFNMLTNHLELSELDGFSGADDALAKLANVETETEAESKRRVPAAAKDEP